MTVKVEYWRLAERMQAGKFVSSPLRVLVDFDMCNFTLPGTGAPAQALSAATSAKVASAAESRCVRHSNGRWYSTYQRASAAAILDTVKNTSIGCLGHTRRSQPQRLRHQPRFRHHAAGGGAARVWQEPACLRRLQIGEDIRPGARFAVGDLLAAFLCESRSDVFEWMAWSSPVSDGQRMKEGMRRDKHRHVGVPSGGDVSSATAAA